MSLRVSSIVAALAFLLVLSTACLERAPDAPSVAVPIAKATHATVTSGLRPLGDAALDAQVRHVIESMDRDGRPPHGVAQGGRRAGRKGLFENAERRLPVRSRGHYAESDVWPRGSGGRGPERVIFGREGEVYYSADHYRTFVRLR